MRTWTVGTDWQQPHGPATPPRSWLKVDAFLSKSRDVLRGWDIVKGRLP